MKERCPARLKDFLRNRQTRTAGRIPPRRAAGTTTARRGGSSASTGLTRPGGYSNASRRQAMTSAEARDFPGINSRYGEARPRSQVAAIEEECPEEAVAALEADADIFDACDFSAVDDQTIAALYEEMAAEAEGPLPDFADEEDFPEGQ